MSWQPDYVDATQLKNYVRINDDLDDDQIALAITASSRAIDRATGRQFGQNDAPVQRFYTAEFDRDGRRWFVDIDDVMTKTDLEVHVDTDGDQSYADQLTDYRLTPINAEADGRPWTRVLVGPDSAVMPTGREYGVRVTATFGWSQVPPTIQQACLLQASRFLFRRDAPAGVAGSPDQSGGSEVRLLAQVDADVRVAVGPYKRWPRGFA